MTARHLPTALLVGCLLLAAGCADQPSTQLAGAPPTAASAQDAPPAASAAPDGSAPRQAATPAGTHPRPAAAEAAPPAAADTAGRTGAPTAPVKDAPPAGLAARVLTPSDLGRDWLMQRPDDAAANEAAHRFCGPQFRSDAARQERVERNFAREDGLRVQQEVNRYATAEDAERALAEYAEAFATCRDYSPSPDMRVQLAPWTAPELAEGRHGARMTLTPTGRAAVHATLAAYRAGALLMVVSVVAETPEPTSTWHERTAPKAVARAGMESTAPDTEESR